MTDNSNEPLSIRLANAVEDLPKQEEAKQQPRPEVREEIPTAALELRVVNSNFAGQPSSATRTTLRGVRSVQDLDIIQRAMLAKCDPCSKWCNFELPTIVNAILYAESLNLSFEQGDVYTTAKAIAQGGFSPGNFSQTANARIKRGYATVKFSAPPKFIIEELAEDIPWEFSTWQGKKLTGTVKNIKLTVMLYIEGWNEPYIHEATLKEWFDPGNPNWRSKPQHMLRLNAFGHACEMVNKQGAPSGEAEVPYAE
jgi:hypothetical protein